MSKLNRKVSPDYSVSQISNYMSLRKPQERSLRRLNQILDEIKLSKNADLNRAREVIRDLSKTFVDFEHDFMSLTFALATGVGKTKLMGAFITYLYANKGVRNFFVVAPNLTIYNKLKNDLGNPSPDNEKYVFRGIGLFANERPNVFADDDYRNRPINSWTETGSINIYIFNISKFNSEDRKMNSLNEYLGMSFYEYLQNCPDLVILMDESHHYRAKAAAKAINQLKPVLGLELTATPQVESGSKPIFFKNVVYDYGLGAAIKDGYTRTPYVLTRKNLKNYSLNGEELERVMLQDGIENHERSKNALKKYADKSGERLVKPFMLVVCRDTKHAEEVLSYIKSDAFQDGKYVGKTIIVHSNQKGEEKEENIQQLLEVEKTSNPIEIVVHVNILKEGWDVNNLYTIVPLRTAQSRTLREQTIGRGLRLPYGHRTGVPEVDRVVIAGHDKFEEIVAEASSPDSIFNQENIIFADEEKKTEFVQTHLSFFEEEVKQKVRDSGVEATETNIALNQDISDRIILSTNQAIANGQKPNIGKMKLDIKKDLAERYAENTSYDHVFDRLFDFSIEDKVEKAINTSWCIPNIAVEETGEQIYTISDFDLDMVGLDHYSPLTAGILLKKLAAEAEGEERIDYGEGSFNLDTSDPQRMLVSEIRLIDEIDYSKAADIINKVVHQFLVFYRIRYSETDVKNICVSNKNDIVRKIAMQLKAHLATEYTDLREYITGAIAVMCPPALEKVVGIANRNIYQPPETGVSIRTYVYDGTKKAYYSPVRFDSEPERRFAVICEGSKEVIRWLRPHPRQFNIIYAGKHRYEPDFLVETSDSYYMVEIKAESKVADEVVQAKKEKALQYCKLASDFNVANGRKPFVYMLIPDDAIDITKSFDDLLGCIIR